MNINLCTPNLNTIKLLNHKFKLLENFKNNDFVPVFYIINSQKSLSNAIKKLDYPNKKIILKPVSSRGSRGIILLNSKSSLSQTFYNNDKFIELNLKELNLIKNTLFKTKNTFLAMHYFEGSDFNIDALYSNGKLINYVAQLRLKPKIGSITSGKIIYNKKLEKILILLGEELNLHNIVNIEIVFDKPFDIKDSKPYLYEINPRPSANMSTLYKNKTFIEDWLLTIKKVKTKKLKPIYLRVYARIII